MYTAVYRRERLQIQVQIQIQHMHFHRPGTPVQFKASRQICMVWYVLSRVPGCHKNSAEDTHIDIDIDIDRGIRVGRAMAVLVEVILHCHRGGCPT